jgi:hypothetical protein
MDVLAQGIDGFGAQFLAGVGVVALDQDFRQGCAVDE